MGKDLTIVIIGVALLAVVWVFWDSFKSWRDDAIGDGNAQVACTLEAKLCPDGSYVGRTGPNCEFATCPSVR